ncbi:hypothetical protein GcM1_176011 [Golovinomyces cichoracearum]|uniref:Uncharacterized protein n=1 Tax=Golovinomyces cichoracearum TaxID=62708 RepID=A0A420J5C3_9PEZI|nr:hypothetical protein GcM1_176011 [Golovinomyces cichoracearum]
MNGGLPWSLVRSNTFREKCPERMRRGDKALSATTKSSFKTGVGKTDPTLSTSSGSNLPKEAVRLFHLSISLSSREMLEPVGEARD